MVNLLEKDGKCAEDQIHEAEGMGALKGAFLDVFYIWFEHLDCRFPSGENRVHSFLSDTRHQRRVRGHQQ